MNAMPYTTPMNTYEVFKSAIERELPVTAHVKLYTGEQRVRVGPVASVNHRYVVIYDLNEGKGFRTTPLELVQSVTIEEPARTAIGSIMKWILGGKR